MITDETRHKYNNIFYDIADVIKTCDLTDENKNTLKDVINDCLDEFEDEESGTEEHSKLSELGVENV